MSSAKVLFFFFLLLISTTALQSLIHSLGSKVLSPPYTSKALHAHEIKHTRRSLHRTRNAHTHTDKNQCNPPW